MFISCQSGLGSGDRLPVLLVRRAALDNGNNAHRMKSSVIEQPTRLGLRLYVGSRSHDVRSLEPCSLPMLLTPNDVANGIHEAT
jgi:hypothetical protein